MRLALTYTIHTQRDDLRVAGRLIASEKTVHRVRRGPMAEMIMDSPEMDMMLHELGGMARHLFINKELRRHDG